MNKLTQDRALAKRKAAERANEKRRSTLAHTYLSEKYFVGPPPFGRAVFSWSEVSWRERLCSCGCCDGGVDEIGHFRLVHAVVYQAAMDIAAYARQRELERREEAVGIKPTNYALKSRGEVEAAALDAYEWAHGGGEDDGKPFSFAWCVQFLFGGGMTVDQARKRLLDKAMTGSVRNRSMQLPPTAPAAVETEVA